MKKPNKEVEMGNAADTMTTWAFGVVKNEHDRPVFTWTKRERLGVAETTRVEFSAETGEFNLIKQQMEDYTTTEYFELVGRLMSENLSAAPHMQEVQNIHARFDEMLQGAEPHRVGEIYDQLEYEWRKLFANPRKM